MNELEMKAYDNQENNIITIDNKLMLYELVDGVLYVTEEGRTIRIRRRRFPKQLPKRDKGGV
jgi:hypothetical protein